MRTSDEGAGRRDDAALLRSCRHRRVFGSRRFATWVISCVLSSLAVVVGERRDVESASSMELRLVHHVKPEMLAT
jgi:hypothetical protein